MIVEVGLKVIQEKQSIQVSQSNGWSFIASFLKWRQVWRLLMWVFLFYFISLIESFDSKAVSLFISNIIFCFFSESLVASQISAQSRVEWWEFFIAMRIS